MFEPEPGGGFHAFMPEFPGVHTFGASRAEALAGVREAAELYLADLAEEGEPFPETFEETSISLTG